MQAIQADTVLIDAPVFVPYLLAASERGHAGGANPSLASLATDPAVEAAVARLRHWGFSTPTGIAQGYDATDMHGTLAPPSPAERAASVAATIYTVWRSRLIANTIDAVLTPFGLPTPDGQLALSALRNLLDHFASNHGVGASGVNFFNVPAVSSPEDRRDIVLLKSLADALALLAGPAFAPAFGGSTSLDDYRWGRLHRIVFAHPLGGPFNIPPAGGFTDLSAGLPGIPTDGGFGTVDVANHDPRAASASGFMFSRGPNHRLVAEAAPGRVHAESSLPGGVSGVPGSPHSTDLLPRWLTNDSFPLRFRQGDVVKDATSTTKFVPAD